MMMPNCVTPKRYRTYRFNLEINSIKPIAVKNMNKNQC